MLLVMTSGDFGFINPHCMPSVVDLQYEELKMNFKVVGCGLS